MLLLKYYNSGLRFAFTNLNGQYLRLLSLFIFVKIKVILKT